MNSSHVRSLIGKLGQVTGLHRLGAGKAGKQGIPRYDAGLFALPAGRDHPGDPSRSGTRYPRR
jgi:hypothetical protein